MITLISLIFFVAVFGKLLFFALKVGWGIMKFVLYLLLLPAIVLGLIFGGLAYIALPVLIIIGIASLAKTA